MVVSSVAYYYLPINNPQVKVSCSMDEIHSFSKIWESTLLKGEDQRGAIKGGFKGVPLNRGLNFSSHLFNLSKL
jgi:hypothetical protein